MEAEVRSAGEGDHPGRKPFLYIELLIYHASLLSFLFLWPREREVSVKNEKSIERRKAKEKTQTRV